MLEHLLLSKESKGRKGSDRGFISYAELGINQLGAVYEGLMSYTGFFADEDLYEVAKNGDPEKGSWVVPVSRADHLSEIGLRDDGRRGHGGAGSGDSPRGHLRVPARRPGTPAVGVVLHARGADEVRCLAGARRTARPERRAHHARTDPAADHLRARAGIGSVRDRGRAPTRRRVPQASSRKTSARSSTPTSTRSSCRR